MDYEEIFEEAIRLDSDTERAKFLDRVCGSNAAQRARIEALLAADQRSDSLLDRPLITVDDHINATCFQRHVGDSIGPYKLLQVIGEGGFGVVYLAEQLEPIRRRVAVKVVKPGMDTKQVLARFEAERQALAMMDHPNIAKVYDGGETKAGHPYFVMELIKGIPITKYSDECQLSIASRLELFVPVCNAIQHAHQKGIIHRDIKPSNILISLYDGHPVPKVIDFGVAKATQYRLTDHTMFTQFGQVIGTLEYMSPEQAELNQLDIDTRSDVYSLGAVLYELLSGSPPIQRDRLTSAAFDEMLRMIREDEPLRPSNRVSTSEDLVALSTQRTLDPHKLPRVIQGELDWIVMKAIDKHRTRRYETPVELAKDVERYLTDEPVEAGPPSATYRLQKVVRKHRRAIAAAGGVAIVLVAATAVSIGLAVKANRAAIEAIAAERKSTSLASELRAERNKVERERQLAVTRERESRQNLYDSMMHQIQLEWEKGDISRVRELLAESVKLNADADKSPAWELKYWRWMCQQELRTLYGHDDIVNAVAFDSSGGMLASIAQDGKLCIWSVPDGRLLHTILAHQGPANCVAFHGETIATGGGDKTLRLWDALTGLELHAIQYDDEVSCLAFSIDGKLLAVGTKGSRQTDEQFRRQIIRVETGEDVHTLESANTVQSVAFAFNDTQLVVAASPNLEFWDVETGACIKKIHVEQSRENNLVHLKSNSVVVGGQDGLLITAGEDTHVWIRDIETLETKQILSGHRGNAFDVALSPDEKTIASSGERRIVLWDADNGLELRSLRGHEAPILSIAFSPDGLRLASCSSDTTIKIWDAVHDTQFRPFLVNPTSHLAAAEFSSSGNLLAASGSGFTGGPSSDVMHQWIDVRDLRTGLSKCKTSGYGEAFSLAFSHDERRLAAGTSREAVTIFDVATGNAIRTIDLGGGANLLRFRPDDQWLSIDLGRGQWPATTRVQLIVDPESGEKIAEFEGDWLAFNPSDEQFAIVSKVGEESSIDIYRSDVPILDQEPLRSWTVDGTIYRIEYSPDGLYVVGNQRARLFVWDAQTGTELYSLAQGGGLLGFDKRGERMFTEVNFEIHARRTGDGVSVCAIPMPRMGCRISSDATKMAFRSYPFMRVFEMHDVTDPQTSTRLEAQNLAAHFLRFPMTQRPFLTRRKQDVLRELSGLRSVSRSVRETASRIINDLLTIEEEASQHGTAALYILVERDKTEAEYREAFAWTEVAYELDPDGWSFNYGMALSRLGRHTEGLQYMESALASELKRFPEAEPMYLAAMAIAQHSTGHIDEARKSAAQATKSGKAFGVVGNLPILLEAVELIQQ